MRAFAMPTEPAELVPVRVAKSRGTSRGFAAFPNVKRHTDAGHAVHSCGRSVERGAASRRRAQTTTVPQGADHPGAACPPGTGRECARPSASDPSGTLSDQLAQSKGVICPPAGVDPEMQPDAARRRRDEGHPAARLARRKSERPAEIGATRIALAFAPRRPISGHAQAPHPRSAGRAARRIGLVRDLFVDRDRRPADTDRGLCGDVARASCSR